MVWMENHLHFVIRCAKGKPVRALRQSGGRWYQYECDGREKAVDLEQEKTSLEEER